MLKNEIHFTRIKNDIDGCPRVICHYGGLCPSWWDYSLHGRFTLEIGLKIAHSIHGAKYRTSSSRFHGSIVFRCNDLEELKNKIINEKNNFKL